jgi:hypothetical protein
MVFNQTTLNKIEWTNKIFSKKKNIMKGCIKRVFSNTIKKVMIS